MEGESYVTSQGEIIRREVNKDAADNQTTHEGVLNGLWDSMKTAAHMAEMAAVIAGEAAHNAKEATTELLDKGMEKAHEAGEMIANTLHLNEEKESGAEKPKHTGIQLHQLAELIIEQSKAQASNLAQTAEHVAEQVAEQVVEVEKMVVSAVKHAAEGLVENTPTSAPAPENESTQITTPPTTAEPAKTVSEQAKEVVENAGMGARELVHGLAELLSPPQQQTPQQQSPQQQTPQQQSPPQQRSQPQQQDKQLPRVRSFKRSNSKQAANVEPGWNQQTLTLTMDVVSHIQRIADRTGDSVLHETARRAHSACAKGLSEAPGVHLTWVTPQQANDLVNLAIRTQDHELADFARYCQSVAATSHIAVEPTPGKIQEEILKGYQELQQQGRVHSGPGYGAAFASVNRNYNLIDPEGPVAPPPSPACDQQADSAAPTPALSTTPSVTPPSNAPARAALPMMRSASMRVQSTSAPAPNVPPKLELTMEVVSHIQRIADRTGNDVLHVTARKAHSAFAKGLSEAPGVHLTWITPQNASELMNLASRTGDRELVDFARYCQAVAATTQVGVEPMPGKIQQEIMKGRAELQKQQPQQQTQQQQPQQLPLQHQSQHTPATTPATSLSQVDKQMEQPLVQQAPVGKAAF